ncbi:hypothetical protein PGANDO_1578, partial [Porphyromonas gingivalis]
GGRLPERSE